MFQPGIGTFAWVPDGVDPWGVPQQAPDADTLKHYRIDMIGTTRMMTVDSGFGSNPPRNALKRRTAGKRYTTVS